jgi:hypothetical protein
LADDLKAYFGVESDLLLLCGERSPAIPTMKITPAGKFESALVRLVDEAVMPDKNATGNRYYMDLNRLVDRSFVDGVSTFVALAEETIIPSQLDWLDLNQLPDNKRIELAVHRVATRNRKDEERLHDEVEALKEQICKRRILSRRSLEYITSLDLSTYPEDVIKDWHKNIKRARSNVLSAYQRRLLYQIYTVSDVTSSYLLIAEPDIQILAEIGNGLVGGKANDKSPIPRSQKSFIRSRYFHSRDFEFFP